VFVEANQGRFRSLGFCTAWTGDDMYYPGFATDFWVLIILRSTPYGPYPVCKTCKYCISSWNSNQDGRCTRIRGVWCYRYHKVGSNDWRTRVIRITRWIFFRSAHRCRLLTHGINGSLCGALAVLCSDTLSWPYNGCIHLQCPWQ